MDLQRFADELIIPKGEIIKLVSLSSDKTIFREFSPPIGGNDFVDGNEDSGKILATKNDGELWLIEGSNKRLIGSVD